MNFCTAIEMLTKDITLEVRDSTISSFRAMPMPHAKSEEARVRMDNVGEYNLIKVCKTF